MIRRLAILVFAYISIDACSQGSPVRSITLGLVEDSLSCNSTCTSVVVTMFFTNDSNTDLLTYGLVGGPSPALSKFSEYCELDGIGTGIRFALFDVHGNQMNHEIEIVDKLNDLPVTKKDVDSTFRRMESDFLKSAITLVPYETKKFSKEVPLHKFGLQSGLYYLQVVYYCGEETRKRIRVHNQGGLNKLFQGCAISQRIPLRVK